MRWSPQGTVSVITGASSGIGRCLSHRLADAGSTVIAVARREKELQETANQFIGGGVGKIIPFAGDITDPETHFGIKDTVLEIGPGRVDLLVNNAGAGAIGPFAEASPQRLRQIMEVNFFAATELTRTLLPLLCLGKNPVLCNVGSVLGHCAVPDKSEYCASKFALHGWSDSIRSELASNGIQVTLISPSTTRSEFFQSLIETDANATSNSVGSWSPERVAEHTFAAIVKRKREVILSSGGKALVYGDRILPGLMAKILKRPRYAKKTNAN